MYKILLGQAEPQDDVIPDFMKEELSGVGNAAQQAMERGRFLKVSQVLPPHSLQPRHISPNWQDVSRSGNYTVQMLCDPILHAE